MLSDDLANLEKLFEMAATGVVTPPQSVMKIALVQLQDCRSQARQLEACIVPRRQRLQTHHLEDGSVSMFPVAPRPESQL